MKSRHYSAISAATTLISLLLYCPILSAVEAYFKHKPWQCWRTINAGWGEWSGAGGKWGRGIRTWYLIMDALVKWRVTKKRWDGFDSSYHSHKCTCYSTCRPAQLHLYYVPDPFLRITPVLMNVSLTHSSDIWCNLHTWKRSVTLAWMCRSYPCAFLCRNQNCCCSDVKRFQHGGLCSHEVFPWICVPSVPNCCILLSYRQTQT